MILLPFAFVVFSALMASSSSALTASTNCKFHRGTDMITARRNHIAGMLQGILYVCGGDAVPGVNGSEPPKGASNTCDAFDGNTWSVHPARMVEYRTNPSNAVNWHDKLVVCGGNTLEAFTSTTCEMFDGRSWEPFGRRMNQGRQGGVLALIGNDNLVMCSEDSWEDRNRTCESFRDGTWRILTGAQAPPFGPVQGGVLNNFLIACGHDGKHDDGVCGVYDGIGWNSVSNHSGYIPQFAAVVNHFQQLWFCGGGSTPGSTNVSNLCMLFTTNGTFTAYPSKLLGLHNSDVAAAVLHNGSLIITGGDGGEPVDWWPRKLVQVLVCPSRSLWPPSKDVLIVAGLVFLSVGAGIMVAVAMHYVRGPQSAIDSNCTVLVLRANWLSLFSFILALYDTFTSVSFLWSLVKRWDLEYMYLFAYTLLMSSIAGTSTLVMFLNHELANEEFRSWLLTRTKKVALAMIICAFNLPSFSIISANIPRLLTTQAPLTAGSFNHLQSLTGVSILVETVPHVIVQVFLAYKMETVTLEAVLRFSALTADILMGMLVGIMHFMIARQCRLQGRLVCQEGVEPDESMVTIDTTQ